MNNKKSTNHPVVGNLLAHAISMALLMGASSAVRAENIQYVVTLGQPAVQDTNADQVTFYFDLEKPVSNIDTADFQLINGSGSAYITAFEVPTNGSNRYRLTVTTGDTGTSLSAIIPDNASINGADGTPASLKFSGNLPTYHIDKTAPDAPIILEPRYNMDQNPVIKGTAEAGSILTVTNSIGTQSCSVTVDADGQWECQTSPVLPYGEVTLTATTVDSAGNVSEATQHDLVVLTSTGDEDGDGITNQDEINLTGTNPLLADSDGDGVSDLVEIGPSYSSPLNTTGGALIDALNPNNDSDGDGLNNQEEVNFGSNPLSTDSDADGLDDVVEQALGLNPNSADSDNDGTNDIAEDSDSDGLPNGVEISLGTDPKLVDSDGNGVDDGDEDHDGDGLSNLIEVNAGLNPSKTDSDSNGISDNIEDTDNDGLNNALEVAMGLNIALADSDNNGVADGFEDTDKDGLGNALELTLGTNPNNPDTD